MSQNPEQIRLLEQIRDTIKNLVDGAVSYKEAYDSYKILRAHASEIEQSINPREENSLIQGIFHNHNISNFCKFSGEISFVDEELRKIITSGNPSLIEIAAGEIKNNRNQIENSGNCRLTLNLPEELTYNVFAARSDAPEGGRIIVSISSSRYTGEEKFLTFVENVNALYRLTGAIENGAAESSFFNHTRFEITSLLNQYTAADVPVKCMLYEFDNIYEIFEHRGLKTLVDIDNKIIKSLQDYHGYNASVSIIGPSLYLVLLPIAELAEQKSNTATARLLFEYEEVIFRYWVYRKIINNASDTETLFYWMSETLRKK